MSVLGYSRPILLSFFLFKKQRNIFLKTHSVIDIHMIFIIRIYELTYYYTNDSS